ncbi:MAG: hypothetical protein J3T61_03730 [Candidatus Brocadiales bacterium]|nr:hypothetical protein [Candidatus Bathyanammoxibius sp.]
MKRNLEDMGATMAEALEDAREYIKELKKENLEHTKARVRLRVKLTDLRTAAEHAKQFIDQFYCPEEGNYHGEECTDLAVAIERSRP